MLLRGYTRSDYGSPLYRIFHHCSPSTISYDVPHASRALLGYRCYCGHWCRLWRRPGIGFAVWQSTALSSLASRSKYSALARGDGSVGIHRRGCGLSTLAARVPFRSRRFDRGNSRPPASPLQGCLVRTHRQLPRWSGRRNGSMFARVAPAGLPLRHLTFSPHARGRYPRCHRCRHRRIYRMDLFYRSLSNQRKHPPMCCCKPPSCPFPLTVHCSLTTDHWPFPYFA